MVPTCSRYGAATSECYIQGTLIPTGHILQSTTGNLPYVLDLTFKCRSLSKEASSTIFQVFGMTPPGIEPMTSCTPGEHSTTEPPGVVLLSERPPVFDFKCPWIFIIIVQGLTTMNIWKSEV